jgi:hypothetical protein
VLRIVLPGVSGARRPLCRAVVDVVAIPTVVVVAISTVVDVRSVVVVYKIVVIVEGDVVVASPVGVVTPASTPCRPRRHSDSEGDCHSCGVVSRRRIGDRRIRVDRRTVNHYRVVTGYVENLWVGLLNHHGGRHLTCRTRTDGCTDCL